MNQSEIFARFENKKTATDEDLSIYRKNEDDLSTIQVGDNTFSLDILKENDELDTEEKQWAFERPVFWNHDTHSFDCEVVPHEVDHRNFQSQVKNQYDRGTCVCFASLACLEAISIRNEDSLDLSEQYANWSFMDYEGRDHCDDGLKTTNSARYLLRRGVCKEHELPYQRKHQVRQHCNFRPNSELRNDAKYGIKEYRVIDKLGYRGPSIANTDYLECILSRGYDIVIGTHVAWGRNPDANGVFDLLLDRYGNPLRSNGGHAMLMVGYNKIAPEPYFILKNSWGETDGIDGYRYLSYDYIRYYIKYGYIILETTF